MISAMSSAANRIGAFALAVSDRMRSEMEAAVGLSGEAASALLVVAQQPGASVEGLRQAIGRSHPATVRIVDKLVERGLVERRPGRRGPALALTVTDAGRDRARAALAARARVLDRIDLDGDAVVALERALTAFAGLPEGTVVCRLCDKGVCRGAGECPVVERLAAQGVVLAPGEAL